MSQNFIDIKKYTSPVVLPTFNWNIIDFINNVVLTLVSFITHLKLKLKVRAGADLRWDTLFSGPGGLRTPDTGWGGWILASLTHTSCCHSDPGWVSASHWSVESSPGPPMTRHWSPQATRTSDTRLRDNWQKTRLWNRSQRGKWKEHIFFLSVYYRHTYGLLNACIAQAAGILDRGRESTRMELLSLTGLGPLDSGLLTLSALSRCHLISLNPLSVAQKLSPANKDYWTQQIISYYFKLLNCKIKVNAIDPIQR